MKNSLNNLKTMKIKMNLKQDDRRYNLVYRNQILVSNQPYIICNGKKGQFLTY